MITEHICDDKCKTIYSLQLLRSIAEERAYKYRWDPAIGPMHQLYADALSAIIEAEKVEVSHV